MNKIRFILRLLLVAVFFIAFFSFIPTNIAYGQAQANPQTYLVSLDTTSSDLNTKGSTLAWNHTTTNQSNRILLVGVTEGGPNTIVTYRGIPLTKLAFEYCPTQDWCSNELFYLINPPSGMSQIVVTADGTYDPFISAGAATFYNVDTTKPFGAVTSANGTSPNNASSS